MTIDQQLTRLESDIKRLRVEFQRFLAGDLDLPPGELSEEIERRLRQLRGSPNMRSAHTFRLTQLEARYNSYAGMYRRRVQKDESGARPAVADPSRTAPGTGTDSPDVDRGVAIGGANDGDVETLYTALRDESGEAPPMGLEEFRDYLARQTSQIRDRTGCADVRYRVVTRNGKTKLTAKPIPSDDHVDD